MTTSTGRKRERLRKVEKSIKTNQVKGYSEKAWEATQKMIAESFEKIKNVELKAETLVDTAAVKSHLGAMEARDKSEEIAKQVQRIRSQVTSIVKQANFQAACGLKRVSDVCLTLRERLLN